ncbi:MAG: alpha/beta hydrolase [Anaerolineales bacterium]
MPDEAGVVEMFEAINGARLYYETIGEAEGGRPPIVLIHGSLATGRVDWGDVPERLSAALGRRLVIVPDCRGHGRSDNPQGTYRFAEMAADTVGLARKLGHPRAHFVGHSNGGNVALLVLMEHAEAVATCVLQAANAYVSADWQEREPPYFDPDRIRQNDPARAAELQALHEEGNGPDYWRDLMPLTLKELLAGPNYTPAELGAVRRPVLVIQGAEDGVNVVGRHAQYLAENIPGAELWLAEGVGHSVHRERPEEWLERVTEFIRKNDETD